MNSRDGKDLFTPSIYKDFTYSLDSPGVVEVCPYTKSCLSSKFFFGKGNLWALSLELLPKAYPEGNVPINPQKIEDIKKLMKYIYDEYAKAFYEEIFSRPIARGSGAPWMDTTVNNHVLVCL